MNISHFEVEIKVRTIDRRNAPITEAVHIMTGNATEITNWLRLCKLPRDFQEQVYLKTAEAANKPDTYDHPKHIPPPPGSGSLFH